MKNWFDENRGIVRKRNALQSICGLSFIFGMQVVLIKEIQRRIPFTIKTVPLIARIYAFPFNRWRKLGQQAAFGAPNFLIYLLFQKISPIRPKGLFSYSIKGKEKEIRFNSLNTQFHALYFKSFTHGFEPQTSALLEALLPDNGVFYDIGSNWGWFSLFLASKEGFQGKIHAFEPYPPSYQDLSSVVEQAGLTEVITTHNVAVSDHEGVASMTLPDRFQSGMAVMQEERKSKPRSTRMATIDSLDLEPPAVMKVDVEGSEAKVFRGCERTLSKYKPMIVFENCRQDHDPWQTFEPLVLLEKLGYEFYQIGWLREGREKTYLLGDDIDSNPKAREILALTKFHWSDRFLRHSGINVFACQRDRLPELKHLFQEHVIAR